MTLFHHGKWFSSGTGMILSHYGKRYYSTMGILFFHYGNDSLPLWEMMLFHYGNASLPLWKTIFSTMGMISPHYEKWYFPLWEWFCSTIGMILFNNGKRYSSIILGIDTLWNCWRAEVSLDQRTAGNAIVKRQYEQVKRCALYAHDYSHAKLIFLSHL